MSRIILILALQIILLPVSATSYYVKNGGNDKADGTSDETSLEHHTWMADFTGNIVLAPGDTVFMKKENTWVYTGPERYFLNVKTNGALDNHIVTTSYGSGAKPKIIYNAKITGSSVIFGVSKSYLVFDDLDISHYSSEFNDGFMNGFNLYDIGRKPCHDWIITNCSIHNIPSACIYAGHDSYNIIIGDTTATSHADPDNHSNHIYDWGYAGVMLLGTDPSTLISNNKVCYNYIHSSTRNLKNDNTYGIALSVHNKSSSWPKKCTIRYNYLEDIPTWHGIDTHGGSYLEIVHNYIKNVGRRAINILSADNSVWGIPPILHSIRIEKNIIENDPSRLQINVEGSFITIFGQNLTPAKNIQIIKNKCFFTSRPSKPIRMSLLSLINADSIYISENIFNNGPVSASNFPAIFLTTNCKNIYIEKNYIKDFWYGIAGRGKSITGKILIRNNILNNSIIGIIINQLDNKAQIEIYNNQFNSLHIDDQISSKASIILRNNIIGDPLLKNNINYIYSPSPLLSGTFTSDFNLYIKTKTPFRPFNIAGRQISYKEWQNMGFDKNSLEEAGLLFRNPDGNLNEPADFIFRRSSPLRNSGDINVEITEDYFGNKRDGNPDIGPVEYLPWWK